MEATPPVVMRLRRGSYGLVAGELEEEATLYPLISTLYLLIAALMNPMNSGLGLSTVLVYSG